MQSFSRVILCVCVLVSGGAHAGDNFQFDSQKDKRALYGPRSGASSTSSANKDQFKFDTKRDKQAIYGRSTTGGDQVKTSKKDAFQFDTKKDKQAVYGAHSSSGSHQ